jgi:hypothetical protein
MGQYRGQFQLPFEPATEDDLKAKVLRVLDPHFNIKLEVPGVNHYKGKTYRIDAIIQPKDTSNWLNKEAAFGIEFKASGHSGKTGDVTKFIEQASDYTLTKWAGYDRLTGGYLPILMCPLEMPYDLDGWLIKRVIGQRGIGEIKGMYGGLAIVFNEVHIMWHEKQGVLEGRTHSLDFAAHHR